MKFIISESQKDKAIFKYLDLHNFIMIEKENSITFLMSEEDKYSQIKYIKSERQCLINPDLVSEITSFFSLNNLTAAKEIIGRWVEDKIQMKVSETLSWFRPNK